MIDTDKYEGTWKIHGMEYWKHWYEGQCEADTNLIHDAPLLLAEVKRLREEVSSVIREMLSDSEEDPSWGATVHAYIKDLQKVIG